ncbi:MAG: HpcH/HpaI aldolase/citrate lyase family protein [Pirellulales bacterium]
MLGQRPDRTQPLLGIWQSLPLPAISRYLARTGWPAVILDMQHGAMSFETAYECVHVLRDAGCQPMVRVSVGVPHEVQRALDIGAAAVVVPMVNSLAEAQAVAAAAKYPPLGERSFGSDMAVHVGDDYAERANHQTWLLVQIEHAAGLADVEAIMAVEGVDGCFVGPTDLALSMGLSRHDYAEQAQHQSAMARIVAACQRANKIAGCNTYGLADAQAKLADGFDFITLRSEVELFLAASNDLRTRFQRLVAERPRS